MQIFKIVFLNFCKNFDLEDILQIRHIKRQKFVRKRMVSLIIKNDDNMLVTLGKDIFLVRKKNFSHRKKKRGEKSAGMMSSFITGDFQLCHRFFRNFPG